MSNQSPIHQSSCCPSSNEAKKKTDWLLWGSLSTVIIAYGVHFFATDLIASTPAAQHFMHSVFELINTMWWGLAIGILMVALLGKIPREFVISILGKNKGFSGILRATLAGVLLDLCSHGILMVGAKLYERGASAGQTIAFLVASPWNSLSLTLILIALIGLKLTLLFILLSAVIAVIAGLIFDRLVEKRVLPENPNSIDIPEDFNFWADAKKGVKNTQFDGAYWKSFFIDGIKGSRPILRWIMFGIVLASLIKGFVDTDTLQTWFGASFGGLMLTIVAATIIEVCSEGSTPIAADLVTRAAAPGNGFAFLMAGVATDYTEIMVLKEMAKSWRFALFLPLITLPQVILMSWLINIATVG